MTEHSITVEKTVEEEQAIYSCNGCGLEVEGDGETYRNGEKELHLHLQCEEELLATSEPDFDSGSFIKLSQLGLGKLIDSYVTAVKYIAAFTFFPLTFVHVYRFLEVEDDGDSEFVVVCLSTLWLIVALCGGLLVL